MALIGQGILDGFSGRVGAVVGYWRQGRWCLRTHVPHIHDARSSAQLAQRSCFKTMILFASPATPALRLGLHSLARSQGLTEGNLFLKLNHQHFSPSTGHNSVAIDYPRLRFAKGGLPNAEFLPASLLDHRTAYIRFEKGMTSPRASNNDRVIIYAYCPNTAQGIVVETRRFTKQLRFLLPDGWENRQVHLWGFCLDRTGQASNSSYIGTLLPPPRPDTTPAEKTTNPSTHHYPLETKSLPEQPKKTFGHIQNSS